MLCPEVCNFKAPESTFLSQKYKSNENKHLNNVNNFIYNHLVSIVLPDTLKVPESLTKALSNNCDYYKLKNVKLSEFVAKNFVNNFVNSGSLYVLTVGARIDCDNSASITPTGQLILSLKKSSYQALGLEGSVSHFHAITGERYIVTIDLKSLKPGKPYHDRVQASLEKLRHDVIVTWDPPDDVCPSSVAKYFHDLGYRVELCEPKSNSHVLYAPKVPTVQDDQHYEFLEWLGMVALEGCLTGGAPDNYVTTYETPEPNHDVGQVRFMQWRGFFTANQIAQFYNKLSEFKKNRECEWVAMYVQGFSDSPVAWKNEEHHFYTNGDNSYTFVLTNDHVISCVQKCSRKRYNNKRKGKPL